jgi:hypothetical protein
VFKSNRQKSLQATHSNLCLFANCVEESSVDMLSQVAGLQRTTLLLVCETRALSGDGTATVSNQSKSLGLGEVVLVVPELLVVGLSVREESGEGTGEGVTLTS